MSDLKRSTSRAARSRARGACHNRAIRALAEEGEPALDLLEGPAPLSGRILRVSLFWAHLQRCEGSARNLVARRCDRTQVARLARSPGRSVAPRAHFQSEGPGFESLTAHHLVAR